MSSPAIRTNAPAHARRALRLVRAATAPAPPAGLPPAMGHAPEGAERREDELAAPGAAPIGRTAHVLVAGADASRRSRMLEDLRGLLPASTHFLEARETWEVIERAGNSRMVVIAGDLGDVSAESLVKVLGRRHPTLPVLAVGGHTRADATAHAASV